MIRTRDPGADPAKSSITFSRLNPSVDQPPLKLRFSISGVVGAPGI